MGHPLPSPLVSKCEPGQPGGRLTLATSGVPRSFNPLLAADAASDEVVRLLFSGLVRLDLATQELIPALAASWHVEADQKTWTFKLRPGLRWSDGVPLMAEDVVFTWNSVMYDPSLNHLTYDLFRIGGKNFEVTKVDDVTVRVVTPEPFAPFVEYFGNVPILPRHRFEPAVRGRRFLSVYAGDAPPERIVGCGPFRLKENQPGKFLRLERNPEYWVTDKQGRRLPYFEELLLTPGMDAAALLMQFINGQCDVFERTRPEHYAALKTAAAGAKFHLAELSLGTERDFLWFNLNPGVDAAGKPHVDPVRLKRFQNKKFRQAVSCALDRDRMAREIYGGRAQPIHAFLSNENPKWNNPEVARYGYDPARARALLAEIGIQDRDPGKPGLEDAAGNTVEFSLFSNAGNPLREQCARFIAQDLEKLGVRVQFQQVSFSDLITRINHSFDYDAVLMGLGGGGTDPATQMNVLKSGEPLHQWHPGQKVPATDWEARMDSLMDAQMRTLDFSARKKLFDEVQVILAEELPMIYTVAPFQFAAVRTNLANLRPSVITPYRATWNVEELYFKKP